jgi:hypothetical protein
MIPRFTPRHGLNLAGATYYALITVHIKGCS